jgi:hypothetical protein
MLYKFAATLKELRRFTIAKENATPSELLHRETECEFPEFQTNPGLELANAFSVIH